MRVFARSPSGTGGQVNLLGVFGLVAAIEEGIELNVLGLTFGVDPNDSRAKARLKPGTTYGPCRTTSR